MSTVLVMTVSAFSCISGLLALVAAVTLRRAKRELDEARGFYEAAIKGVAQQHLVAQATIEALSEQLEAERAKGE